MGGGSLRLDFSIGIWQEQKVKTKSWVSMKNGCLPDERQPSKISIADEIRYDFPGSLPSTHGPASFI